ncbi:MAG: signal peptidase I, partial [Nitrospinota bacterium]|nr:signal peptidase I [Nitrospinota bacterium]
VYLYILFFIIMSAVSQVSVYIWHGKVKAYKTMSASMEPTLAKGDHVMVMLNDGSYSPGRGDVVVVLIPGDRRKAYIKRIVGLPGETIQMNSDSILINGKPLYESYLPNTQGLSKDSLSVTIPANAIFVLGDNRANSLDSRNFGPIPMESVLGKVVVIHWSWSEDWTPRWKRIGTVLSPTSSLP